MIHIKRFVDRLASLDGKNIRDLVIPISEAKGLRDEITLLLLELRAQKQEKPVDTPIQVEIRAGKW